MLFLGVREISSQYCNSQILVNWYSKKKWNDLIAGAMLHARRVYYFLSAEFWLDVSIKRLLCTHVCLFFLPCLVRWSVSRLFDRWEFISMLSKNRGATYRRHTKAVASTAAKRHCLVSFPVEGSHGIWPEHLIRSKGRFGFEAKYGKQWFECKIEKEGSSRRFPLLLLLLSDDF